MRTNYKYFLLCLLCITRIDTLLAQDTHWQCDPYAWQHDMTCYLDVSVNGKIVTQQKEYEIAAFCGDECRGVGKLITVGDGEKVCYMRIRSNVSSGEQITFRVYNSVLDKEILANEFVTFESQAVIGLPSEPFLLDIIVLGDVDDDGQITAQDALLILKAVAGNVVLTPNQIRAGDVNGDGNITAQDASLILQYIAGKISW